MRIKRDMYPHLIIITILILGAFFLTYKFPTSKTIPEKVTVTKVIDGDTIIVEGGFTVRLLGIDSDERGYPCYQLAKNRLEELVLNREVRLEKGYENKGKYGRYLRYIFLNNTNINLKLIKEGAAIARFSGNSKYKEEIQKAEKFAKENRIGCEWKNKRIETNVNKGEWGQLTSNSVKGACNAENFINEEVIVQGKVVDSYKYKNRAVFLNFEKPYPNACFTAVIWEDDWNKFPENPEKYYLNKLVRVKGEIDLYKGKPQVILENSSQIEINSKKND